MCFQLAAYAPGIAQPGVNSSLYCELNPTETCRYFAEAPAVCSGQCDNCQRQMKVKRQDMSTAAAAVVDTLQTLPAADKRLTLTQLVDAWHKSQVTSPALCLFMCLI